MAWCSERERSAMSSEGPASEAAEEKSSMRPCTAPTFFEPYRSDS